MACGVCGGGSRSKPLETTYELTKPDGTVQPYTTKVEAQMQRSLAGGGTIRTVRKPKPAA